MNVGEFREHLAGPLPGPSLVNDEILVPYDELPDRGVPKYSRGHVRRLISRGLFPPPVQLSPNRIAWRLSDLAEWKASRPIVALDVSATRRHP